MLKDEQKLTEHGNRKEKVVLNKGGMQIPKSTLFLYKPAVCLKKAAFCMFLHG